jgi:predicted enzyme related to lactoylglutathione lyase
VVRGYYFEIPVQDLQRAISFYEALFAISMEREEIDGNQYAHFPAVEEGPGISGSLALGESYLPSRDGTRIYLSVDSSVETLRRARELGGETLYPKTAIGEHGFVAEFADSEGNCVALHEGT